MNVLRIELEDLKMTQMKVLEMKTYNTEMKNIINDINSQPDTSESQWIWRYRNKKISKIKQREKKDWKKNEHSISDL